MAYRRSNGKGRKLQPAMMTVEFLIPNGDSYIDLALALSLVNRRAYKQENVSYAVRSFEFQASGTGTVAVGKLPDTWVYKNAYQKTRALYHEMNDQVLDEEEGIQGKYADFKIYMDTAQQAETIQTANNANGKILTPLIGGAYTSANFDGTGTIRANWDWSQLVIPNDPTGGTTTRYYLHATGASTATSKSLIEGYALSRARPQQQDPNTPVDAGWMNDLFDDGQQLDELRADLADDNDRPPYAVVPHGTSGESYPGGSQEYPGVITHGFCNFTTTTVSGKNTITGGMFQNGLVKITNGTGATMQCLVHMMPGDHRGYMCEAMD